MSFLLPFTVDSRSFYNKNFFFFFSNPTVYSCALNSIVNVIYQNKNINIKSYLHRGDIAVCQNGLFGGNVAGIQDTLNQKQESVNNHLLFSCE